MNSDPILYAALIAPCGMNCAICMAHLRKNKPCPGCSGSDQNKPPHCVQCRIKHCDGLKERQASFCIECAKFPCLRMKQLDKRYRTKYAMSMLENLEMIKAAGMETFVRQEQTRWACPHCGGTICVHTATCSQCGQKRAMQKQGDATA